jgi:nitrite reductase/ring-hydroxylating ferredoxin subunit
MKVKCSCPECTREFDAPEGHLHYFCSIECAVYAQKFSVKSGFVSPELYEIRLKNMDKILSSEK